MCQEVESKRTVRFNNNKLGGEREGWREGGGREGRREGGRKGREREGRKEGGRDT